MSTYELISLIWGVLATFIAWYSKQYGLPIQVVRALKKLKKAGVTDQVIQTWIIEASKLSNMTSVERRNWVKCKLLEVSKQQGFELSKIVAHNIVEDKLVRLGSKSK